MFKAHVLWAVVVAQLVERSHLRPGIRSSNPDNGKQIIYQLYYRKDQNKEKEAGKGSFKKG